MKKILVVANNSGGLFKFRKEMLEYLVMQGHQVFIAAPDGRYRGELGQIGCEYICTPLERRGKNPLADIRLFRHYKQILDEIGPDVVLTFTIKPNIYGGLLCRMMGIKYIACIPGMGSAINKEGILRTMVLASLRISLKNASCIFFENQMNMDFFKNQGIVGKSTRLVPGSGVNLAYHQFEEYPEDDKIKFLFVGRIMMEKGINEFLQAAQNIKNRYPHTEFLILGPCEEGYEGRLEELEQQQVIKYYGFQEDVHSFYKLCHAVVLPSYHEGMSNVLLEAASSGRPIIASAVPGCRESFDEGISGFGVQVKNADDLTAKLEKFILLTQEERKQMGLASRAKVEREFERQKVIDSYVDEINKA